jgi:WD40 repeat protein
VLYNAFLSYSHAADGKLAPAVQSGLQRFAKPWYRLRVLRVFRDKTTLSATPALWPSIETALSESEYFLFMASPLAAQSHWVEQEITWWLKNRSVTTMLILLTDGELTWDTATSDFGFSSTTAWPTSLPGQFRDEPLYVDLRWARAEEHLSLRHLQFRAALLDIAAPLHGKPKDELDGEDVRQYRRTRRLMWLAVVILVFLTLATSVTAYYANQQRNKADQQRVIAEHRGRIALSRQLAAQAINLRDEQIDLALLLALEGHRVEPTSEAWNSLRTTVEFRPYLDTFLRPKGKVRALAFEGNHKVITCGIDGVCWWDVTGPRVRQSTADKAAAAGSAADDRSEWPVLSRDGKTLAIPRADSVCFRDMQTGRSGTYKAKDKDETWAVAFSNNGKFAAIGTRRGEVVVWDVAKCGPLEPPIAEPKRGAVMDLVISSDGGLVIWQSQEDNFPFISQHGIVRPVFESWLKEQGKWWPTEQEERFLSFALSFDDKTIAFGGTAGSVLMWDVAQGKPKSTPVRASNDHILSIEFDALGQRLATAGGKTVVVWDLSESPSKVAATLEGQGANVSNLAFSDDGSKLASCSLGQVIVWDLVNRSPLGRQLRGPFGKRYSSAGEVAISGDGRFVASTALGGSVEVLDTSSQEPSKKLPIEDPYTFSHLALDTHGEYLAEGFNSGMIVVYALPSGKVVTRLQTDGATTALAFVRDGKTLALTNNYSSRIGLCDFLKHPPTFQSHPGPGRWLEVPVALSSDGETLVAGGPGGSITVWNYLRETTVAGNTAENLKERVLHLAIDGKGKSIAACDTQGNFAAWNIAPGQYLAPFTRRNFAEAIAFNKDGSSLITELNGRIILWNTTTDWCRDRAAHIANRSLTQAERKQYLGDEYINP